MTAGIDLKIYGTLIKPLFLPVIAYFFAPIYDWIILQVVQDYSSLSPVAKAFLNDSKQILGLVVIIFTLIRLGMGSYKLKKEIEALKKQDQK